MKYRSPFILLGALLLVINTNLAAESDIDILKAQQLQLQSLLNDVEKASQQRAQQTAQIERLKHQLECNWTLIRSYEICEQLHKDNPEEHLNCSSTAKRTAATCISASETK